MQSFFGFYLDVMIHDKHKVDTVNQGGQCPRRSQNHEEKRSMLCAHWYNGDVYIACIHVELKRTYLLFYQRRGVYRSLVLLSDLKDLKFCSQHESPDYKILKRTMKSIHVGHGLRKLEVWLLLRVFHSYLPYFYVLLGMCGWFRWWR